MLWLLFSIERRAWERRYSGPVIRDAECQFYLFCQPAGLLHDTLPAPPKSNRRAQALVNSALWVTSSRNDKNASASFVPGATWPTSVVVVEGVEKSSVKPCWASSDARSAGRAEVWDGAGAENPLMEQM